MEPIKAVSPTESGTYKSGESYRKWNQLIWGCVMAQPHVLSWKNITSISNEKMIMEQKRLNLYLIDMKYIRNLARADDRVMSVSPQAGKETRPFVGIVVVCGTREYCVPLSSPKPKHKSMKNDMDFTKIMDGDQAA